MSLQDREFLVKKAVMYIQDYDPSFSWKVLQDIEEETTEDKEGSIMTLLQYTLDKERKKGWQKGRQKGRQEGIKQGRQEVALNLLSAGLDMETVAKGTGLSEEEIKKLKNGS